MDPPIRFITGGGIRIDFLITRKGEAHNYEIGGNAIYSAVGAATWSSDVFAWGRIGENYPPEWVAELECCGIDTSILQRVDGNHDHRTFFAYRMDGIRDDTNPAEHYARIGLPMPELLEDYEHSTPQQDDPLQFEPLALRSADYPSASGQNSAVHLAPSPLSSHLELAPFLRQEGVSYLTVDPGERYMIPALAPYLKMLLPHVDAFLPSEMEIRSLFGSKVDLLQAARTLCDWGAAAVVIKRGAKGVSLYFSGWDRLLNLLPYHAPGHPSVVDVTGAGDSFCGGFLTGLARGKDGSEEEKLLQSARMGLVSASYTIEGYGALYPLKLDRLAPEERLAELKANQKAF